MMIDFALGKLCWGIFAEDLRKSENCSRAKRRKAFASSKPLNCWHMVVLWVTPKWLCEREREMKFWWSLRRESRERLLWHKACENEIGKRTRHWFLFLRLTLTLSLADSLERTENISFPSVEMSEETENLLIDLPRSSLFSHCCSIILFLKVGLHVLGIYLFFWCSGLLDFVTAVEWCQHGGREKEVNEHGGKFLFFLFAILPCTGAGKQFVNYSLKINLIWNRNSTSTHKEFVRGGKWDWNSGFQSSAHIISGILAWWGEGRCGKWIKSCWRLKGGVIWWNF